MRPINFPTSDGVLGAPRNWDADLHGPCEGLPVQRIDGSCVSCWRVNWRERLAILLGKPIWLWVTSGDTQPPVSLAVIDDE